MAKSKTAGVQVGLSMPANGVYVVRLVGGPANIPPVQIHEGDIPRAFASAGWSQEQLVGVVQWLQQGITFDSIYLDPQAAADLFGLTVEAPAAPPAAKPVKAAKKPRAKKAKLPPEVVMDMGGSSPAVHEMAEEAVDLRQLGQPGSYPSLHEKLARELATEIERAKDPDYVVVSWAAQEKAQDYFNTHGFADTLTYMLNLRDANDAAQEARSAPRVVTRRTSATAGGEVEDQLVSAPDGRVFLMLGEAGVPIPSSPPALSPQQALIQPTTEAADFIPTHVSDFDSADLVMAGPVDANGEITYADLQGELHQVPAPTFYETYDTYSIPDAKDLREHIEDDADAIFSWRGDYSLGDLVAFYTGTRSIFGLFENGKYHVLRQIADWPAVRAELKPLLREYVVKRLEESKATDSLVIVRGPDPRQLAFDYPQGMVVTPAQLKLAWEGFVYVEGVRNPNAIGTEVVACIMGGDYFGGEKSGKVWRAVFKWLDKAGWLEGGGVFGLVAMKADFDNERKFLAKMSPQLRDWIAVEREDTPADIYEQHGDVMFVKNLYLDLGDEDDRADRKGHAMLDAEEWATLLLGE